MQGPDSESGYGLVEAAVSLYEATEKALYLDMSERAASLFTTWIASVDAEFPQGTTLDNIDAKATGCVLANVRNKHQAPGICTYSGSALLRLARITGKWWYAEALRLVVRALPQFFPCQSVQFLPATPKEYTQRLDERRCASMRCPSTQARFGTREMWHGSCWSEYSLLLSWAELPGIYLNPDQDLCLVFDHVEASVTDGVLHIHNPTAYDAEVSVLLDHAEKAINWMWRDMPKVSVSAGASIRVELASLAEVALS